MSRLDVVDAAYLVAAVLFVRVNSVFPTTLTGLQLY